MSAKIKHKLTIIQSLLDTFQMEYVDLVITVTLPTITPENKQSSVDTF